MWRIFDDFADFWLEGDLNYLTWLLLASILIVLIFGRNK